MAVPDRRAHRRALALSFIQANVGNAAAERNVPEAAADVVRAAEFLAECPYTQSPPMTARRTAATLLLRHSAQVSRSETTAGTRAEARGRAGTLVTARGEQLAAPAALCAGRPTDVPEPSACPSDHPV